MSIDYVSRAAFLPAVSRVAMALGTDDPLVTLQELIPSLEFAAEHTPWPWCVFEPLREKPRRARDVPQDEHLSTVLNPYTIANLDRFVGVDAAFTSPLRIDIENWKARHNFRDDWIADNATASLIACIVSGMETRDGPRTLKWVRSLDPECGLLEFSPSDDPAWFFERTQSADAYGLEMEKWFHAQVLKRRKAQIQFRQGERVWFNTTAELAAWRFAGKTYAEIARRNQTEPDTVRKAVDAYCARTGLLMPGAVRRDASVN